MKTNSFIFSLLVIFLTGCSTYKTDTDITFRSTILSGLHPVIPVGNEVPSNMVTYLGWVEAEVTSPHLFSNAPTEEQVNIVLAEKAKAIGADAVIHVEYNKKINVSARSMLNGKGQAVRINAWHIGEPDPTIVMSDNLTPNTNRSNELEQLAKQAMVVKTPKPNRFLMHDSVAATAPLTTAAPKAAPTLSKLNKAETASLERMLQQAKELKNYAKLNKDKAMYTTATALIRHIEDHMIEFNYSFE